MTTRIRVLTTGGTIACRDSGHGLAPALTAEDLLASVPAERLESGIDCGLMPASVPVAVRQENLLATSFHPEVTGDWSFHRYFLDRVVGRAR